MTKKRMVHWIICLLTMLFILFLPLLCKAGPPVWKFYVMGVDVSEFRGATTNERAEMVLGGLFSLGVHITGHYIAAELFDVNLSQIGLSERINYSNNPSAQSLQWVGRGGFLFQIGINTLLSTYAEDSFFTKGFTGFTAIELSTYPCRRIKCGDFDLIDRNGGNGDLEYFLYSTLTSYNLWRLN